MKIVILLASQGRNKDIATTLSTMTSEKGADVELVDLIDLDLPLYSGKKESEGLPKASTELTQKLLEADGIIVMSPEYNGGVPPSLTNAIAWVSRNGDDWRAAFNNKPVLLATHSGGAGLNVLTAMRHQFSYVGSNVIGRTIQANFKAPLNEEGANACIEILLKQAK